MWIFDLDPQQWNQVRAALQFWRSVAEVSNTHPSRHPSVAALFKQHAPLSLEEIETLLESTPKALLVTPEDLREEFGYNPQVLSAMLNRMGIEPVYQKGKLKLYRTDTVMPLVAKLEAKKDGA